MMVCKIRNCCHSLVIKDYRFLKLLFTTLALYLILDTFYTLLVLKPTYTSNERRKISPEDFPEIIVCPEPPLDTIALRSKGYKYTQAYFRGDQFGWTGNNSEDLKTVSAEISTLKSIEDYQVSSGMKFDGPGNNSKIVPTKFELIKAVNPHHMCLRVIPPQLAQSYPLLKFNFYFIINNTNSALAETFQVFLVDKLTGSYFYLNKAVLGEKIFVRDNVEVKYRIKIVENIKLEKDPNYPCIDYKIEGEYAKCVENEMVTETLTFMNCTPPWMTRNENSWCHGNLTRPPMANWYDYVKFMQKIAYLNSVPLENCLVPCKVIRYEATEFLTRNNYGWDLSGKKGYKLWFEDDVEVIKSSWKLDEFSLVSKIGGFIGTTRSFLWLIILFTSSAGLFISYVKFQGFKL